VLQVQSLVTEQDHVQPVLEGHPLVIRHHRVQPALKGHILPQAHHHVQTALQEHIIRTLMECHHNIVTLVFNVRLDITVRQVLVIIQLNAAQEHILPLAQEDVQHATLANVNNVLDQVLHVHLLQWHSSPRQPSAFIYNPTIDVPRLGTSFFSNHMYLYFVLRDIQTKYKYIPRRHILRRVQTPENNTKILCAGFGRRISNKSWWFAG